MSAPGSGDRGLSRRQLLSALAALPFAQGLLARAASALPYGSDSGERVLVVLELVGGNDGLNTLVPFADDDYHRARPVLAIEPGRVLRLTNQVGLNPPLRALLDPWERGELALLQGVGPPQPDRSHFRSREMWHTARLSDPAPTEGWLGLTAAALAGPALPMAKVGERESSLALAGAPGQVPALSSLADLTLRAHAECPDLDRLCSSSQGRDPRVARVARAMGDTRRAAAQLASLDDLGGLPGVGGRLSRSLALAAQLIGARLGSRVLYLTQGGYDTHAAQQGEQGALHRELADGLAGFGEMLARQGDADRVVTLVFSEFGRRVAENASAGTDHGAGGPVLLLGRPVTGGVTGHAPDLRGDSDHDVPVTLDFRRVYAELLGWLGVDSQIALGGTFERLGLLAGPQLR